MRHQNVVIRCLILASALVGSYAQCDNVLLPSVGDLSECLDRRLGVCGTNSEEMLDDLQQFFDCMFNELPTITDPVAAFFNLEDFSQLVLSALELPVNVSSVARLLCYRLNFSLEACTQPAVSNGVRCGPLLSVFFPSSFTVRQCVDRSSLVCFEGEELSTRTLKQLFVAMACAFEGAPTSLQPRLARHLACPLVELLRLALRQFSEVLTWPLFAAQIRDSVEQLATLLLHLASCQNGTTPTTSSTANTMSTLPASSMKEDQGSTTNAVSTRSALSDPTSTAVSSSSSATGSALNWNETTTAANTSAAATSASVRTATMLSTPTPAPTTTSSEAITNITSISTVIFSTNVTTVATNSESTSSTVILATISSPDESSSSANSSPTLPAMGTSGFLTGEQENSTNSGNTGISINVTTVSTNSDSTSSINTFSTTSSPEGSLSTTNTGPAGTSFGTSGSITAAQEMGTNSGNATHSTTPAQPEETSNFPTTINATVSVTTNAGVTTSRSPTLSSSAAPSDESPTILGSSPEIPSLTPMSSTMLSTSPPIATQTSSSSISEAMPSSLPTPPQESTPGAITASAESSEQTRDEPGSTASVTVSTRSGSTPTNTLTAQTNLVTTVGTGTSGQADPSSIPEGTSSTSPSFTQLSSTVAGSTMTQTGDDRYNTTSTQQYSTSQSTVFSGTAPAISTATDITNVSRASVMTDSATSAQSGTTSSRLSNETVSSGASTPENAGTTTVLTSPLTAISNVGDDPAQTSPSSMPITSTILNTSSQSSTNRGITSSESGSTSPAGSTQSEAEITTADRRPTSSSNSSSPVSSASTVSEAPSSSSSTTLVFDTSASSPTFTSNSDASPTGTTTANETNFTSLLSTTPSLTSTESSSSTISSTQDIDEPVIQTTTMSTYVTSVGPTTSSSESCVDIALPNIFGLDTCLGAALDACSTDNDAYEGAGKVVRCTIRVLSASLSLQCVLAAVKDLIIAAFSRFNDEGDDSLSSVLSRFTCENMVLDGESCNGNIQMTFPRRFSQCGNGTRLCSGQEPVQEPLVSSSLDQVKCILVAILGDAPPTVLSGILCEVSSVLAQKVRQLPFFSFLRTLLNPILQLLRRIVGLDTRIIPPVDQGKEALEIVSYPC